MTENTGRQTWSDGAGMGDAEVSYWKREGSIELGRTGRLGEFGFLVLRANIGSK